MLIQVCSPADAVPASTLLSFNALTREARLILKNNESEHRMLQIPLFNFPTREIFYRPECHLIIIEVLMELEKNTTIL